MTKKVKTNDNLPTVHFRLSEEDIAKLDCCAKIAGLSRSAYVRNVILSHISAQMAEMSISHAEKIVRKTMETLFDLKTEKEAATLRNLLREIQRANFMQLKNYIELHPGLDMSEYRAYYYQSKKEAYELYSGKREFETILQAQNNPDDDIPEWLKILSGENSEN